ncbi:MAG: hypothetical protein Q9170_008058 [Blastenia crenularia]
MPEPLSPFNGDKHMPATIIEDEEAEYDRHTMAMSYMISVVHFFPSGEPRFDVIDSKSGKDALACVEKELDHDHQQATCRLFITEDLPRATHDLLEHVYSMTIERTGMVQDLLAERILTSIKPHGHRQLGSKYLFHTSTDLWFSRHGTPGTEDGRNVLSAINTSFSNVSHRAIRTRMLLRQMVDEIGHCVTDQDIRKWTLHWIIINAQTAFEASAEASIRSWHSVKSRIKTSPTQYMHIKRLCEQLRKLTEIKIHQMDKAYVDLSLDAIGPDAVHTYNAPDDTQPSYILPQWHRSHRSMHWVLNDIDHVIRSNESRLQIDLVNTQIEESRKAMQQAETVKRLTALAFVFIPISTVCSAFGMNIREFSHNLPSAWVFATVALAVAISTVICSTALAGNIFWAVLSLLNSSAARWRNWWQDVYDTAFTKQASFSLGVASIGANLAGVKPWQDPERKEPMKFRSLQRNLIQAVAFLALTPFWLIGAFILHIRRFEQRGRAFRERRPT